MRDLLLPNLGVAASFAIENAQLEPKVTQRRCRPKSVKVVSKNLRKETERQVTGKEYDFVLRSVEVNIYLPAQAKRQDVQQVSDSKARSNRQNLLSVGWRGQKVEYFQMSTGGKSASQTVKESARQGQAILNFYGIALSTKFGAGRCSGAMIIPVNYAVSAAGVWRLTISSLLHCFPN